MGVPLDLLKSSFAQHTPFAAFLRLFLTRQSKLLSAIFAGDPVDLTDTGKILFLKLSRIPALFLILLRIFLKLEGYFLSPPCSFYSKVMADGTRLRRK